MKKMKGEGTLVEKQADLSLNEEISTYLSRLVKSSSLCIIEFLLIIFQFILDISQYTVLW